MYRLPGQKQTHAFTLVELMISVSIMVVITAAILPSFSNYLGTQTLLQVREKLRSDFRSVQTRAMTGYGSLRSGVTYNYWAVVLKDTGDSIKLENYLCENTTCAYASDDLGCGTHVKEDFVTYTEKFNITSPANLPACIFFDFETGGIETKDSSGNSFGISSPISLNAGSNVTSIYLYKSGLIY